MLFSCVWLYYENFSRKYFHVFGNILKMLFSTTTHTKPITTTKKKIRDQREKVKNQNHKQILLQKFQMRTRTRLVMGSRVYGFVGLRCDSPVRSVRCDSRFVGLRCNDLGFLGSRSLSLSLSLSLFVCTCESFLSLFLSLRVFGNDLKVKFWLKIFSGSKALILRLIEILFRKIHFPCATKPLHFRKSISRSDLKSKQTQP